MEYVFVRKSINWNISKNFGYLFLFQTKFMFSEICCSDKLSNLFSTILKVYFLTTSYKTAIFLPEISRTHFAQPRKTNQRFHRGLQKPLWQWFLCAKKAQYVIWSIKKNEDTTIQFNFALIETSLHQVALWFGSESRNSAQVETIQTLKVVDDPKSQMSKK